MRNVNDCFVVFLLTFMAKLGANRRKKIEENDYNQKKFLKSLTCSYANVRRMSAEDGRQKTGAKKKYNKSLTMSQNMTQHSAL